MKRPPKPEYVRPTLTPEQTAVKERAELLEREIRERQRDLARLVHDCKHVWVAGWRKVNPYEWADWLQRWWICAGAYCLICGVDGGWYCEQSPTHQCEYADDDHAQDNCIHCGMPDERK